MTTITREDAKNLLGLATAYDTLANNTGVAVTEEMKDWNSEKVTILRSMLPPALLAVAPVLSGWAETREWLSSQSVQD